jgi:hypothetical protein
MGVVLFLALMEPTNRWPPIVAHVLDIVTLPGGLVMYLYKPHAHPDYGLLAIGLVANVVFYSAVAWTLLGLLGRNRRRKV